MICTHGHNIVPAAKEDLFFLDRNFQIRLVNIYFQSYTKKKNKEKKREKQTNINNRKNQNKKTALCTKTRNISLISSLN